MRRLKEHDLITTLTEQVLGRKVPILGICLGIQLFTRKSEEGTEAGLGWIDAETIRFRTQEDTPLRIPHMGWNTAIPSRDSFLFRNSGDEPRFYFVHSYHLVCHDPGDILSTTRYGYEFPSAITHENIYGVQFHPEKSHRFGIRMFQNFLYTVIHS